MKQKLIPILGAAIALAFPAKADFHISKGSSASFSENEKIFVKTAFDMLQKDMEAVTGAPLKGKKKKADIIIGTVGVNPEIKSSGADLSPLDGREQAFLIEALPSGKLLVAGSDSHGTVYGMMELSRIIGVSPWEWWADVVPEKKETISIEDGFRTVQCPDVKYRGIFINDEDWGLMPWSGLTHEPQNGKGVIGAKTNERIFELLVRLRANHYWPAMHECTRPFFLTDGNREAAEKYGIYIGGSHCEPMASSTAGEWPARGKGKYDFVNNRDSVVEFWEERLREVAGQEILYTLGMRGVHDSKMLGANTVEEQKSALADVLKTQRELLAKHIDSDVTRVPQVFIPYKEVLDVYNAGLEVPDDVTLMWCDDNYGYIRHFPTENERQRKGGNGIYYHVSYWGRPHDYLWLGTFSPYLLFNQMSTAYDKGIRDIWILNVGDIKPAEYQTELFMDMAWDMDKVREMGVGQHLLSFLAREFGEKAAERLLPAMKEHYRLAHIRKPEFMGNTRVEEGKRQPYYSVVRDLPWNESEIKARLDGYRAISDSVESVWKDIPANRKDAFFQLVKYPLQGASQMNVKHLSAQLARHGLGDWGPADMAYDSIASLTKTYNDGIGNNGKWRNMMDMRPRKLPVFGRLPHDMADSAMVSYPVPVAILNGNEAVAGNFKRCDGLGHGEGAISLKKGDNVSFSYTPASSDSIRIELCFLPTHPIDGETLRVAVVAGDADDAEGNAPVILDYATKGRSEEWKENVLRNQAIRSFTIPAPKSGGRQSLTVAAIDDGVILDQIRIYNQ